MTQNKTTLWQKFSFSDVSSVMKKLEKKSVEKNDLDSIPYINCMIQSKDHYPQFNNAIKDLRVSPFKAILKFEKSSLIFMFWIHISDVCASLTSALLSIQILKCFEKSSDNFSLIDYFYIDPTYTQKLFFAFILAVFIFVLNIIASSLHAQKIEREMFLSWRIPFKIMQYIYQHLLNISKKERIDLQSGTITNLAQNDARYLGDYYAHSMVDIPVMIFSCIIIMYIMLILIGKVAWIGFFVICLQIPLSMFFSWIGRIFHHELMLREDKRIHLVSEWIQGMRLIRYFGWEKYFNKEIYKATLSEYFQGFKIMLKYSFSFALTMNWWMVVSSAIFAGIVYFDGEVKASTVFSAIWLSAIFGQQLTPLPWFVNIWSQALIASKRLKSFYLIKTQEEEFIIDKLKLSNTIEDQQEKWILRLLEREKTENIGISFELENVSFLTNNKSYLLKNIFLSIPANKTLAIVGPVASGKSILIQIIMGDLIPTSGRVLFKISGRFQGNENFLIDGNVHTLRGITLLRLFQSYVPQEAFIINSSIRENIPLLYNLSDNKADYPFDDKEIMNSLYLASFGDDLKNFSSSIDTEIGERGVNLSGGQKQRISLARSAFSQSQLIFFDDPLSAVDVKTEKELVANIFSNHWGKNKTIIWATHRLDFLSCADKIIFLDNGLIVEQGSYSELMLNKESRLKQFYMNKK